MKKFKEGDRVVGTKYIVRNKAKGIPGTIICVREDGYSVEFDQNVNGHSCSSNFSYYGKHSGKNGHCWNCSEREIELLENQNSQYEIY